eukprot:TRINITY_DN2481_c0_g1_i1.p1 TRINITY_DN2481_c0_g1~~TRINITY_DN2481_c0_g1_i1.p1  ORF type:complete len:221 (+),score=52.70 TRINITY_DN2481_c0_g1_i1:43-663(+)
MKSTLTLLSAVVGAEAVWSLGPESFNCKMRNLAWEYGQKTLPKFGKFENLYYALGLNDDCKNVTGPVHFTPTDSKPNPPVFPTSTTGFSLYVDFLNGDDSNNGSISHPLKTISSAVIKSRGKGPDAFVYLRAGTHYLTETVQITAENSGLTIQNYNGEEVVVSGGKKLDAKWSPYNINDGNNMYVTDVADVDYAWGFQVSSPDVVP